MLTLRTLAIVITGAGVFAGLPLTGAQACDDDRYPCPIRVQETADAPAQAAPSAQPQKKASHAARPNEKAASKARTGGATRHRPREGEQTGSTGAGGRLHLAAGGRSRSRDGAVAACGSTSQ